jgi:hypothetical protein
MTGVLSVILGASNAPLSASLFPSTVNGSEFVLASGTVAVTVITESVTATASGGQAPYTYLWEYVSGDTATATTGTSASTTFSRTVTQTSPFLVTRTGLYRCRVTDALSTIAYTGNVTVNTTHEAEP